MMIPFRLGTGSQGNATGKFWFTLRQFDTAHSAFLSVKLKDGSYSEPVAFAAPDKCLEAFSELPGVHEYVSWTTVAERGWLLCGTRHMLLKIGFPPEDVDQVESSLCRPQGSGNQA